MLSPLQSELHLTLVNYIICTALHVTQCYMYKLGNVHLVMFLWKYGGFWKSLTVCLYRVRLCTYFISRYVSLTTSSPELALLAVQLLTWVSQSHTAGCKAVNHIISDKVCVWVSTFFIVNIVLIYCMFGCFILKEAWSDILQGFVEHLETEVESEIPTEGELIV